jgi:pimeloyl-ACP methyl ester carboxylesterase
MNGMEMAVFRRNLKRLHGVPTLQFSYSTVRCGIDDNSRRLADYIAALPVDRVDLVGHSLGGVLALQTLKRFATTKVRRVVCLGSPLVDSSAARNLSRWSWGRTLLGRTIKEAVLDQPLRSAGHDHPVGVIGGTVGLGLGVFVGQLRRPHDGMVTIEETQLPGISAHLVLPVNHFGLIFSRTVAEQTCHFLRDGEFN